MTSIRRFTLLLSAAATLSGCTHLPQQPLVAHQVSADYMATGGPDGARALIYGGVTLLELESHPALLSAQDASGESVRYERVGRFYRFDRALDRFTVWLNGDPVRFDAIPVTRVFSAPASDDGDRAEKLSAALPSDPELQALLDLSVQQRHEIDALIAQATTGPDGTDDDLDRIRSRASRQNDRLTDAGAVVVHVVFQTASTVFQPHPMVADALIKAAHAADRINLRGRTDSRVAGPSDPRIARDRALSARRFLIENGVGSAKIGVYSLAAGDFAAPSSSPEGRAINRRVELEFIGPRIAALGSQAITVAEQGSPQ